MKTLQTYYTVYCGIYFMLTKFYIVYLALSFRITFDNGSDMKYQAITTYLKLENTANQHNSNTFPCSCVMGSTGSDVVTTFYGIAISANAAGTYDVVSNSIIACCLVLFAILFFFFFFFFFFKAKNSSVNIEWKCVVDSSWICYTSTVSF
jgi:hypothetical protein